MKKKLLVLFTIILSYGAQSQTSMERLRVELDRLDEQLHSADTTDIRIALDRIAGMCNTAEDWTIPFKFNYIYGSLEIVFCKNELRSIPYLRKAYELYPTNVPANVDFTYVAEYLACAYSETKQYEQAERIAADALIRAASLNDSLPFAIDLFSVLAECYEQRGDTIMPRHFHRESQKQSILLMTRMHQADSLERMYNRLNMMYNFLEQDRMFFTKDHPVYIFRMGEYLGWVANSGNITETIWLGERLMQIAQDSSLDMDPQLFGVYLCLLYAYAGDEKMDRCEQLLPRARRVYSMFAKYPNKDGILYYYIANGLMDNQHFEEAIDYFHVAMRKMDETDLEKYSQDIQDRIAFCNEKKGFGKH